MTKRPTILIEDDDDSMPVTTAPRPNGRRFMTSRELAEMVGMKQQTVDAWRFRGGGPPFTKINGAVRYDRATVEAWLASRTGTTLAELTAAGV